MAAADDTDDQQLPRSAVVSHLQSRLFLDHLAFSRTSTTRQRFCFEIGRVSMIRTRSPTPHSFCSSWALSLVLRRTTFLYTGCCLRSTTLTTTVLSMASPTTWPTRTLRRWRPAAVLWSSSVTRLLLGRCGLVALGLAEHVLGLGDRGGGLGAP